MNEHTFINLTPHDIQLNSGEVYKATGNVARVSATYTDFGFIDDKICLQEFGDITGLPAPAEGVYYIVSAIVLSACKAIGRNDCVAPATGHPECVRDNGFIVSVPGFVK